MPLDLEFYITIGGTDVTTDTINWSLEDIEDGISTIDVTVASPDDKYAGKFSEQDEIKLSWGAQGQVLGPVEFLVRKISERWTLDGYTVQVTAYDWTEKLTGMNVRGMFDEEEDTSKIAKDLYEKMKMTLEDATKPGKRAKDNRVSAPNMSANQFLRNNVELRSGKADSATKKPYKELKEADKDSSVGGGGAKLEKGPHLSGGFIKGLKEKFDQAVKDRTAEENVLDNQADHAGSLSIRAKLKVVDYPFLRAKEGLTVTNVGPKASGYWYVDGVTHRWDVAAGYGATCSLMRVDTKKDQADTASQVKDKSGAPIVRYAEIFTKNKVYMGPRKLDAGSQMTFACGDGKHVVDFEWTLDVQSPKDVGESAKLEDKAPNMPKKLKEAADQYSNLTAPV